ncbi:AAA family ATPase [Dactylosporangium sp. NPDC000244]|uniref:ATP-binding protein n=1 Tax=Dactylosporangium sp. NPDC000244 TaxID=3154365 RepID=UPI0033203748
MSTEAPIVGRGAEVRLLHGLVERVRDEGSAIVVRGEAGIGKSALVAETARVADRARMRVLSTTGVQSEAQIAFAGLYQLLRPVLDQVDRLSEPQRGAVLAAFGRGDAAVADLYLIALGTLSMLGEAAAQAPVLLVVEDAQWLDAASADVLVFVARRLEFEPVVLLAALRDGFDGPFADSGLPELVLARLDRGSAERVLDGRAPGLAEGVRLRVLHEAAGNPLALVELPAVLAAGEPAAPAPGGVEALTPGPAETLAAGRAEAPALGSVEAPAAGGVDALRMAEPTSGNSRTRTPANASAHHNAAPEPANASAHHNAAPEPAKASAYDAAAESVNVSSGSAGRVPGGGGVLPLTARLEQAFADRMSGLPDATRAVLVTAALNDGDALRETLAAASITAGAQCTADDLAPAIAARLVEVEAGADGERLRFVHPLMRSAIHQRAGLGPRYRTHAALAQVIPDDDRRVWHRAASTAGPDDGIAAELDAAAVRAQRRGGVAAGVAALERAAALSRDPGARGERLLRAAELAFELGRRDAVGRLLGSAERLTLSERQRWRTAWIRDSFDDGVLGRAQATWSLAQVAGRAAAEDPDLALNLLYGAALRCWWTEPGVEARASVVAAAGHVHVDARDPRLLVVLAYTSPIDCGEVVLGRLREPGVTTDARAARMSGNAAMAVGAFDLAAGFFAGSLADLRAQGRLGLLARALALQSWCCSQLVDLDVAMPAADEAFRLARDTSQPIVAATARATQAILCALRGDADEAERLAAQAERASLPGTARAVLAAVQHARGLVALGAGRHADALADLLRIHDPADPAYHLGYRCFVVPELAEAAVRSGQPEAVAGVVAEMEAVARRTPSPALHHGLRHARALLAGEGEAEPLFQAALRAEPGAWPFARARVQLSYGEWLRRQRRVADSRAHLRAARGTFDALGTIPWGERARAELRASGEASRGRVPDARDRLTPQELQIAQLAAEGLTNREIGQRLYLSHRTVGSHLHRIFPKLGIVSRAQLRAAMTVM